MLSAINFFLESLIDFKHYSLIETTVSFILVYFKDDGLIHNCMLQVERK